MCSYTLTTSRLTLRQWTASDINAFAMMSAKRDVMRYFPDVLSEEQSIRLAHSLQHDIANQGWGLWAIVLKDTDEFIGFTGLRHQNGDIPLSPFMEIAWRLDSRFWHRGYATEAALAALSFAFNMLSASAVYAFTTQSNLSSITLMKRLGMKNMAQDFKHPQLDEAHPLAKHVLYGLAREDWQQRY